MATSAENGSRPSEFEVRRAVLVGEIGDSLEQVLQQMNALNRSLEGIIEIGNEFAAVEALWSQFETVMGVNVDESTSAESTGTMKPENDGSRKDGGEGDGKT